MSADEMQKDAFRDIARRLEESNRDVEAGHDVLGDYLRIEDQGVTILDDEELGCFLVVLDSGFVAGHHDATTAVRMASWHVREDRRLRKQRGDG